MRFLKAAPLRATHYEVNLNWLDKLFIKRIDRTNGFNRRMFNEDFSNIFRTANRRSDDLFIINSNNDDLAGRLLGGIQTRYRQKSKDDKLIEVIEQIAQTLMSYRTAIYYVHNDEKKEKIHIIWHNTSNILRIAGQNIQYNPNRVQQKLDDPDLYFGREVRLIDSRNTLCFKLLRSIRKKINSQNRILASLDRYDGSIALKFQPRITHEDPNPRRIFDFKQWQNAHDLALYRATLQTGWNARKYDSEKRSDFFDCHRRIRFRRLQLALRDDLLKQLSKELTKVGQSYSPNFTIEIRVSNKLPSVTHLDELEARLMREEAGFSEVIDYCLR